MSGAYLYRRLINEGIKDIDIFDVKKTNPCGCRPCAWGFASASESRKMIEKVADPDKFQMYRSDIMSFDGIKTHGDVITVDKPALIRELVAGADIKEGAVDPSKYDRVIDATGVSRAYLPPIKDDVIATCVQYRVKSEEPLGLWFKISQVGYEWCFPLNNNEYHVGFGDLKSGADSYKPDLKKDDKDLTVKYVCKCRSSVRLTSPYHAQPLIMNDKIVGIGESIGAVSPLVSDGNIYAMKTAEMLVENWDDLNKYSASVLKEYDWMRKERSGLEKLRAGKLPTLSEVLTMKRHCKNGGVDLNISQLIKLFKHMTNLRSETAK